MTTDEDQPIPEATMSMMTDKVLARIAKDLHGSLNRAQSEYDILPDTPATVLAYKTQLGGDIGAMRRSLERCAEGMAVKEAQKEASRTGSRRTLGHSQSAATLGTLHEPSFLSDVGGEAVASYGMSRNASAPDLH